MPRIKFDFLKVVLPQLTIQKTKHYFPEYQCRKKLKISFNFNNTNVMCHSNCYIFTEIKFKDFKEQILELRQKVWEQTDLSHMKQVFVNGFFDEHDEEAFHWGIFDDNKTLIASARLTKHLSIDTLPDYHLLADTSGMCLEFPLASLNRLAISKEHQKNGISDLLDQVRIAKAIDIGCVAICGMTYGKRGRKLFENGFAAHPILTLTHEFDTDKPTSRFNPPAFYYRLL